MKGAFPPRQEVPSDKTGRRLRTLSILTEDITQVVSSQSVLDDHLRRRGISAEAASKARLLGHGRKRWCRAGMSQLTPTAGRLDEAEQNSERCPMHFRSNGLRHCRPQPVLLGTKPHSVSGDGSDNPTKLYFWCRTSGGENWC